MDWSKKGESIRLFNNLYRKMRPALVLLCCKESIVNTERRKLEEVSIGYVWKYFKYRYLRNQTYECNKTTAVWLVSTNLEIFQSELDGRNPYTWWVPLWESNVGEWSAEFFEVGRIMELPEDVHQHQSEMLTQEFIYYLIILKKKYIILRPHIESSLTTNPVVL